MIINTCAWENSDVSWWARLSSVDLISWDKILVYVYIHHLVSK